VTDVGKPSNLRSHLKSKYCVMLTENRMGREYRNFGEPHTQNQRIGLRTPSRRNQHSISTHMNYNESGSHIDFEEKYQSPRAQTEESNLSLLTTFTGQTTLL